MQQFLLSILMMLDNKIRFDDSLQQLKLALITHDPIANIRLVTGEEPGDPNEITEDEDLSDTSGTWKFRNDDKLGQEDVEDILNRMGSGSFSMEGKEMGPDDEGWM